MWGHVRGACMWGHVRGACMWGHVKGTCMWGHVRGACTWGHVRGACMWEHVRGCFFMCSGSVCRCRGYAQEWVFRVSVWIGGGMRRNGCSGSVCGWWGTGGMRRNGCSGWGDGMVDWGRGEGRGRVKGRGRGMQHRLRGRACSDCRGHFSGPPRLLTQPSPRPCPPPAPAPPPLTCHDILHNGVGWLPCRVAVRDDDVVAVLMRQGTHLGTCPEGGGGPG